MKQLLIFLLLVISSSTYGQDANTFFTALKNKDTNTINKYLSSDVDLCIGSYQDFLSKSVAINKINSFLEKENPSSFELLHKGNSKNANSLYSVAKFKCKSGIYRVFIYFEKSNTDIKISEIRFDK